MSVATRVAELAYHAPDEMRDEFRQFRGAADEHQWGLGQVAAKWVARLAGQMDQEDVEALAASDSECSLSQVRKCRQTWLAGEALGRLDEPEYDVLTFDHFAKVRFQPPAVGRKYLNWAIASASEFGGRIASAARMARKMREDGVLPPLPTPTFADLRDGAAAAVRAAWKRAETDEQRDTLRAAVMEAMQ